MSDSKHPNQTHPAVGLLRCVKAYQAGKKIPGPKTEGGQRPWFDDDGLCHWCGFDEAFHKLTESDYVAPVGPDGKVDPGHAAVRTAAVIRHAEETT